MCKKKLVLLVCLFTTPYFAQKQSGLKIIKAIHTRYFNGPCKCYAFSQKNTLYRNDSVIGNSVWHEVVEFPDKFKIYFGEKAKGNFVVFKNDSVFNYRNGTFTKSRSDSNTLLLILGGLFYRHLEDVTARLNAANYNLSECYEELWNNETVYVIGATKNNLNANQIWIQKKDLRVVRIIETMNNNDIMDMRFEAHQDWCKGYVETKVSFRRNGKLEQVEEYFDIKVVEKFE